MGRRRVVAVIFGALIAVFIAGSMVTLRVVRDQLIGSVDDDLAVGLDLQLQLFEQIDSVADLEDLGNITVAASETTTVIVTPTGEMRTVVAAGPATDPFPMPDVSASQIIARNGESFTADGTDDGPAYRMTVGQLDDGRFLVLGRPIDDVRAVLWTLSQVLLLTLLGVVVVLGLIFWLVLRASLRPYDDMVDTAEAIAAGDMDRRATPATSSPEIAKLAASLNTMLDRLQESFDDKAAAEARVKQFAADASHELRTPLTTISGYSELYLSGAATSSDDVAKQMQRINGEAARMSRLVEELLTLARLDQGRGLDFEQVELGAVVRHVVEDARAAHPDLVIAGVVPATATVVLGDPDALHQMLANLVTNARVHAPGSKVTVTLRENAAGVTLAVRDDGAGMAPDVAAHVFDRFYRVDEARQSSTSSSGLGLAIVHALTEAQGGSITLTSAFGEGSEFVIVLPSAAQVEGPHAP